MLNQTALFLFVAETFDGNTKRPAPFELANFFGVSCTLQKKAAMIMSGREMKIVHGINWKYQLSPQQMATMAARH